MKALLHYNGDIISDVTAEQCTDLQADDERLRAEFTNDRFVEQFYAEGQTHLVSRLFNGGELQSGYARLDAVNENDTETARIAGEALNRIIKAPRKRPAHKQAMRFIKDVLDEHEPSNQLLTDHDGSGVHEQAFPETHSEIVGSDTRPILFFETAFVGPIAQDSWLRYKIRVQGDKGGPIEQAEIIDHERKSDNEIVDPAVHGLDTERLRFFLRQTNRNELTLNENGIQATFELSNE